MQKKQLKQSSELFKTLHISFIVWILVASGFVSANEQYYIYPSDVIKENRNMSDINKQGIWRYQDKIPLNFYGNENPYPR